MGDIKGWYQIEDDSNEMWIANHLWEETEKGQVHYLPGLHPLDANPGILVLGKFIGIHIICKPELKSISAHLLTWAFVITVHHWGNGDKLLTDN